ncbi:MAG: LamG domain-containing protein [Sedimentisphaerales bacterium]|nr:LamG domain-containing protein [Sedimentisphaerales bacterium]
MKKSILTVALVFAAFALDLSICCAVTGNLALDPVEYVPGQSYFGRNNYIEYIAGNSPIIVSAPHGGYLTPAEIPDRTWGTTVQDTNTQELARTFSTEMFAITGRYPHVIICHLKRIKLDANREITEAAQGSEPAEIAWHQWHDFINLAEDLAIMQSGCGNYIDLHGHGHSIQRLELGYLLNSSVLELSDPEIEHFNNLSSLRTLSHTTDAGFAHLLRGPESFGALMQARGFPSVPSPQYPDPGGNIYFEGGYNTRQHSSRHGGRINGFQIECNYTGVRDTEANRILATRAMVESLEIYLARHYGINLNHLSMNVLKMISDNWIQDTNEPRHTGQLLGRWSFDDGTANDSSGNGHHGTLLTGDPGTSINIVYDAARGSQVLDLNNPPGHSINSVLDCGGNAADGGWADLSTALTITAWIKVDTFHIAHQYLITKGNSYQLTRNSSTNGTRTYMTGLSDTALNSSLDVNNGQWHHIAVVYDSYASERIIYIDGQEQNRIRNSNSLTVNSDSFVIGGRRNTSLDHRGWDGKIDDVRLYDYALNPNEILLVRDGSTLPTPQPELTCYQTPPGDLNQDCKVNLIDYVILASQWLDDDQRYSNLK